MTPADNNYFLHTICHLREQEEMLIYDRWTSITREAEDEVGEFLRSEYEKECMSFPFAHPFFEPAAAIWGGKIIFYASQLLLSREKGEKDIRSLLSFYPGEITPVKTGE